MNALKNLRNVAIIIACLAATTMISGCSKDTNNSGNNPDNPTFRVISAWELITVEDAERILGETLRDSTINKREYDYDNLHYYLSPHSTSVYLHQEALFKGAISYDKNDWDGYLKYQEEISIEFGETININNANAYYSEEFKMSRLQIYDSGYRIQLFVEGGGTNEEQMLYNKGKVIEIGTLALERLREIIKK
jgi:hypothetical protein